MKSDRPSWVFTKKEFILRGAAERLSRISQTMKDDKIKKRLLEFQKPKNYYSKSKSRTTTTTVEDTTMTSTSTSSHNHHHHRKSASHESLMLEERMFCCKCFRIFVFFFVKSLV